MARMQRMRRYYNSARGLGRGAMEKAKRAASNARKKLKEMKGTSKLVTFAFLGGVGLFAWLANKYKWLDDLKKPKQQDDTTNAKN